MSLKFLIAVLEWLQDQFIKANEKHTETAKDIGQRIAVLKFEQAEQQRNADLANKLANKIDKLLTE
jgi:hypothetical protein